ncbi:hypothetical protein B0H19DRAFT_1114822 [Mycena capillaripes]|nr:hypothetical protein B0H19DRAFT_1114822 [Mycena capillaripes]
MSLMNCEKLAAPICADCHAIPESLTSQCTDQCVVVPCSEDAPVCDMDCPGGHCDLVCEDPSNCGGCSDFDEFLQCCTDFHSYYEEPRNNTETTWAWDPSLKTFVCSCGGRASDCFPSEADSNSPLVADSTPSTSPRATPVAIESLACMWGNCGASFSSLSALAEHVNLVHLCHPPAPSPPTTSNPRELSCQWKDCTIYPTPDSVPGPSSGDVDSTLSVLASHLLHDHLGMNGLPSWCLLNTHSSALPHLEPHASPPPEPVVSSPPPSEDASSVGHICQWSACGQSFPSLDDLTQHLTEAHVGSGKTSYDCHWQDCSRHGENGFTSKQKLCRHLQSHTGHRPFQCKICQQNFSEAATLQQHMRRHTQEKPYLCDYPGCGKSFAITGALTIHKRTHNGEKPFKCPRCDKQVLDRPLLHDELTSDSEHSRNRRTFRNISAHIPAQSRTLAKHAASPSQGRTS